ncbi:MAG: RNA polymerase sigma factor [Ardenticatenaceae bacterium]
MTKQSLSELSDQALVQLCLVRVGDERPFRELYQRHQGMVWRVCYRFMSNEQDADDLTQEVFLKVYRKLAQYKGQAKFSTWLYRIATTTCIDEKRQRARRPAIISTPVDAEHMAESLPATSSIEEDELEQERKQRLLKALERLKASQRHILLLGDFENKPYKEIAQDLGISLSATKMRVMRARSALQTMYRKIEEEESQT